jgi:hypothetical protein
MAEAALIDEINRRILPPRFVAVYLTGIWLSINYCFGPKGDKTFAAVFEPL